MTFLALFGVALLVGGLGFAFLQGVTWKEFLVQLGASAAIAGISMVIIYYKDTADHELWNGRVTGKKQVWVSCSHSYSCNCRQECSGSGKDRSCSTVCDTCYEHSNDWDWRVYASFGGDTNIDRIDRRGSNTPPRWDAVVIGEPFSESRKYTSYIKASPDTLFRKQGQEGKYLGRLPVYPGKVHDYYRANRLVTYGSVPPQDFKAWNEGLSEINANLGSGKQVNMVVVLTDQPHEWYYALEEYWIGGKKNDAILVIGVDPEGKATWAQVMAWTTSELFKVQLRDAVIALPKVTPEATLKALETNVSATYKRKPMADFAYLKSSITPTEGELTVSIIINLILAIVLTFLMNKYDLFGEEGFARNFGYGGRRRRREKWEDPEPVASENPFKSRNPFALLLDRFKRGRKRSPYADRIPMNRWPL